jgi:WD40 repeat protein
LALSVTVEDDSIQQSRFAKKLCQYIHVFEGRDNKEDKKAADSKAKGPVGAPILLENRQKIRLRLTDGEDSKYTCVTKTQKGFLVGGLAGNILFYERTDDKREPYMEVKSLCIGSDLNITGLAMMPSEHLVVTMTESGRLISIPTQMTVLPVATVDENGDEEEVLKNSESSDLSYGGTHVGPISSAAVCLERPIIATLCVEDNSIRIWNYETEKCEVNYNLGSDEPISLALHKNGLFMIVSFKDRLRGYNIAMANLIPYKEVIQKGCKKISFSHGGQYFACASGINLVVFDTTTFTKLQTFQGHMMPIKCITWEKGDLVLFSASVDGTIMGWPIARDGRMDLVPSNPRASAILDLEVEGESTVFLPPVTEVGEDGAPLTREEPAKYLLVSSNDGHLKTIDWYYNEHSWNNESKTVWGEDSHAITCMKISQSRRHLFAGTRGGAIRVYAWPLTGDAETGLYVEIRAHSAAVVGIFESPRQDSLMSVGEDGAVFIYTLDKAKWSKIPLGDDTAAVEEDDEDEDLLEFNDQILLMGNDEMEEHLEEVSTLQRSMAELQSSSEYKIMQLQTTNQEEMNMMSRQFEGNMNDERGRYDHLRKEFDDKVKSLLSNMEAKEADSVKVVNDLENRYEHKLADQLDRYDRLSEEMELLRQKCEGLLLADRSDFTKQLNDTVHQARVREKKMRAENKRVTDDRASDEAAFKEILGQQENEYEDELRQLISAAEGELIMERENITKLRTLVQTKNTKLDQLKKRLVELNLASKARLSLLNNEKAEKKKLLETIEHYKKNLAEREEVVAEKEKIIMELRSKTRTLENFRFVLDYRLQQLSAERGPITSHIEGLERHISTMYEELVEEFEHKKNSQIEIEKNDQRSALVQQELSYEKVQSRKRERYINSFKRELGNIVSAMVIGKELEESVRLLYRKYVKGEAIGETTVKASDQAIEAAQQMVAEKDDDLSVFSSSQGGGGNGPVFPGGEKGKGFQLEIEETLIESAKEAERQKVSKEKEAYALKRSLSTTRSEALVMGRKRLNENSNLLFEVNDLRKQLRKSDGKIWQRDERIKELEHQVKEMKKGPGGLLSSRKKLMPSIQAARPAATPGLQDFNAPTPHAITPSGDVEQESGSMEAAEGSDEHKRPDSASVAEQAARIMQPRVMVGSKSLKSIGMDTRTMKGKPTSSKQNILNTNTLTIMDQSDTGIMPLSDEIEETPQFEQTGHESPTTQQGAKTTERVIARVPSSKIATGMNQKKSTIRERMIDRLQNEVDVLSEQLDNEFMVR